MHQAKALKHGVVSFIFLIAVSSGSLFTARAQEAKQEPKKSESAAKKTGKGGRDVFTKYVAPAPVAPKSRSLLVVPPSIEARIERYRAQKVAAMNAHLPAPKPTTALLLSEIQVVGISRTPRGYAAIVEATPIKLSYVIYPGERLYDGQLVAIEDSRLVFRRETLWTDGRHDSTVEMKALRQFNMVEAMASVKAAAGNSPSAPAAEPDKKPEAKPLPPVKPQP